MTKDFAFTVAVISFVLLISAGCLGDSGEAELKRLVTERVAKQIPSRLRSSISDCDGVVTDLKILRRGKPMKISGRTRTPYMLMIVGTSCDRGWKREGKCITTKPLPEMQSGVWLIDDGKGNLRIEWMGGGSHEEYFR